jgi:hypothetical protein
MRIDRPELRAALGQYLGFVRQHEAVFSAARPLNDVVVLHAFPSLAFNGQYAMEQIAAVEEVLIRSGYSWGVAFDDDLRRLDASSVVVLAGQTHLSDATCAAVQRFADRGGAVVLLGDNGLYDDEGRLLEANRLAGLHGARVSRLKACQVRPVRDRHWGIFVTLPPAWKQVAATIRTAAADRLSAHLREADTTVTLNAGRDRAGRLVVHLVNYAAPKPTRPLQVELGTVAGRPSTVRLLTPGVAERTLTPRRDGVYTIVDVPPVEVYGILVADHY